MRVLTKKLRVAMIVPDFPLGATVNGGIQGVGLSLGKALMETREISLDIVFPFAPANKIGLTNVHGLNVHALNISNGASFLNPFLYARLVKAIQKISPDVVHVQGYAVWSRWCPTPSIVTIHGIGERDVLYKGSFLTSRLKYVVLWLLEGRARRRVKNVIAISPYVRTYLGNPRKQNIWNIPNPVNEDFFAVKRHPIALRVFSAGHVTPLKNTMSLIRAFAQIAVHNFNAELRIAGSEIDSAYGVQCRRLVKNMGLEGKVHFLGVLSPREIREELAFADCFALCSFQENAPLSVAEAMAAGVPILASNVGGIPWMIEDGCCGKLVDPQSVSSIVNGLESVLFSSHSSDYGRLAKSKAEATYRSTVVARKTVDAYQQLYEQS